MRFFPHGCQNYTALLWGDKAWRLCLLVEEQFLTWVALPPRGSSGSERGHFLAVIMIEGVLLAISGHGPKMLDIL